MLTCMKECRECHIEKPLSDYYRHAMMRDGHLNKCKPCVRSRVRRHRDENIDRIRAYDRKRGYREYDAVKAAARRKVNHELAAGRLVRKPCVRCGDVKAEAHHEDYSKPLDVVWMCKTHHAEAHHR